MKKEDILSICLDEIRSGRSSLEDCLARYPKLRNELRPLLEIAANIRPQKVTLSPEFKQKSRIRLQEMMEATTSERESRSIRWQPRLLLPARALSLLIACLMIVWFLITAAGTVYASQGSLPGDTLYPVKIATENLQLMVTVNREDKAYLHLKLAERRVDEVTAESSLKQIVSTSALAVAATQIDNALRAMDKATPEEARAFASRLAESSLHQQIMLDQIVETAPQSAKPALQQAQGVAKRGNIIAQVVYGNPAFLSGHPSVREEGLEEGRFQIQGILVKADERTWNVGGVMLENVNSPNSPPPAGTPVKVDGLSSKNRVYIIKCEHDEKKSDQVKIKGVFSGTSSEGTTWYISGIPIVVQTNEASPAEKERLEISGAVKDGTLNDAQIESRESEHEEQRAELEGILTAVNVSSKTITVDTAGALLTINIGEADIKAEHGEQLAMSDLAALVGKEVEVEDVYSKDGSLYAKEVRMDVEVSEREGVNQIKEETNGDEEIGEGIESNEEYNVWRNMTESRENTTDHQDETDNESETIELKGAIDNLTSGSLVMMAVVSQVY